MQLESLRALLILIGVKQGTFYEQALICLRALLILIGVKHIHFNK